MHKSDFKQPITKQDVINLLNSMINEKNINSIDQYINKISTLDDNSFQQELYGNNILTMEDVRKFFIRRFSELKRIENDKNEQSKEFQKCSLSDLDVENTYFHFTDSAYLKSIRDKGLISNIGKHSEGIDEKESIFFSHGIVATIQGADVWIKWIMNRMYGEKNQFHIYDGLNNSEIKAKQYEWATEFLNDEYLNDKERKEKAFKLIFDALKGKAFLALDLKPEIDFSIDDTDYNKKRALNSKENGNMTPYLYMKKMYGNYSEVDRTVMDKWNMHTHFGAKIEPERIIQVTDSNGRIDMLHILIEMYDRCKSYEDFQVDILGDFISYAKQKEISAEKISTQRLGQETLEEQKDTALLNEIESVQAKQQRAIIEQRDTQENGQNR